MGRVHMDISGGIAVVRIENPGARNAMTLSMYEELEVLVLGLDPQEIRAVMVMGGAAAFASGTDIATFRDFRTGEDGLRYEAGLEQVVRAVEDCPVPTLAAMSGACTGGGTVIAAACDLRIATSSLRFGVPIARTLGNCLSMANLRRLVALLGLGRVQDMMLRAQLLGAEEALSVGLVSEIVAEDRLEARGLEILGQVIGFAPLTIAATRRALRSLSEAGADRIDEACIRQCYGSSDFRAGVEAFLAKRAPHWSGT